MELGLAKLEKQQDPPLIRVARLCDSQKKSLCNGVDPQHQRSPVYTKGGRERLPKRYDGWFTILNWKEEEVADPPQRNVHNHVRGQVFRVSLRSPCMSPSFFGNLAQSACRVIFPHVNPKCWVFEIPLSVSFSLLIFYPLTVQISCKTVQLLYCNLYCLHCMEQTSKLRLYVSNNGEISRWRPLSTFLELF